MIATNERLQRAQEQQAARLEDLRKGRIRIERPKDEQTAKDQENTKKTA